MNPMGNTRNPRDPYPCDLTVGKEDLRIIKKTNWIDGFMWGALLGGLSMLLSSLFISVVF